MLRVPSVRRGEAERLRRRGWCGEGHQQRRYAPFGAYELLLPLVPSDTRATGYTAKGLAPCREVEGSAGGEPVSPCTPQWSGGTIPPHRTKSRVFQNLTNQHSSARTCCTPILPAKSAFFQTLSRWEGTGRVRISSHQSVSFFQPAFHWEGFLPLPF